MNAIGRICKAKWLQHGRTGVTFSWDRCPSSVRLTDVSPRDGLQNEPQLVDAGTKVELIQRLRDAGLRSIETTAFVNAKLVPQMADAAEVLGKCVANDDTAVYPVVVPNLRGLRAASAAGAREVTIVAAASDTFARKNTNCTVDQTLERAAEIVSVSRELGVVVRSAISVCFGCPYEGHVPPTRVAEVAARLLDMGCQELAICDTIGSASPASMVHVLEALQVGGVHVQSVAVHLHDTYGQAVANFLVALQHGVAMAYTAVGGLGGCPFAGPGASGNVATEDIVHLLDSLGVETGVDLPSLAATGSWVCRDVLGREVSSSKVGIALERTTRSAHAAVASAHSTTVPGFGPGGGDTASSRDSTPRLPLAGIRVIEVGPGLIGGGWVGATLAYFGAEVIKIEPPDGGDGIRKWRHLDGPGGDSLWWQSIARNKQSVAIDLRVHGGRTLLQSLACTAHVLVENFKPGTLERWGMGPGELRKNNPGLVIARLSGYGQTGPKAGLPGFASVCEGVGGFRHINGFPDMPPVRPNLSIGDTLAAMNATIGILLALRGSIKGNGPGQEVDASIVEGIFGLLESCVPEYDRLAVVRGPSGSTLTGIVPTGTYPCKGGSYAIIGANGDSLFRRLMEAMGRHDLAEDNRLADNAGRVEHQVMLDMAIAEWTSR